MVREGRGPALLRSNTATSCPLTICPDTRNSFATSKDGLHWTKPADLTGPPRIKGYGWIARGLWKRDGELLALASHFNAPGYDGPWTEPGSLSLERHEMGGPRHGP